MASMKALLHCLLSLWLPLTGKPLHHCPAGSQTCPRVLFPLLPSPQLLAICEGWGAPLGLLSFCISFLFLGCF